MQKMSTLERELRSLLIDKENVALDKVLLNCKTRDGAIASLVAAGLRIRFPDLYD